jgi:hypothetical protein
MNKLHIDSQSACIGGHPWWATGEDLPWASNPIVCAEPLLLVTGDTFRSCFFCISFYIDAT